MSKSRPVLLPENRKLRHLRGLYIRNLTFRPATGTAADDSALALAVSGKAKGGKLRVEASGKLAHARSSDDLVREGKGKGKSVGGGRWSANESEQVTSLTKQQRLQMMISKRLGDLFFSLHCEGEEEAIYISEVMEKRVNFNFQFFDLKHHPSPISRSPIVTVKLWTRRHNNPAWIYLLEDTIDLRHLTFLPTLENQHFPHNGLIFHLGDGGMYTFGAAPTTLGRPRPMPSVPTSSYNALMKLATLESSIHDAQATQHHLSSQIDAILSAHPPDPVPLAHERTHLAEKYTLLQRRALHDSQRKVADLRASIASRRAAMAAGREAQGRVEAAREAAVEKLEKSKVALAGTKEAIKGQRRRICADLTEVFRIEQIPGGAPLAFQIRGIPLPNSVYDSATSRGAVEDGLSAGLGMVAHLVDMLQYYLGVPLPYPVHVFGSRASICDEISLLPDLHSQSGQTATGTPRNRVFPLWLPRGGSTATQFRFDYAWFLLNKDIEILCTSQGLRVVDIRHTLPNLQYLLYVCSAGTDDLPERKRGGIRGLWSGRRAGSSTSLTSLGRPSSAHGDGEGFGLGSGRQEMERGGRRGSWDAGAGMGMGIRQRGDLRRDAMRNTARLAEEGEDGEGNGEEVEGLSVKNGFVLPFSEEGKVTLRTKGMRENVG